MFEIQIIPAVIIFCIGTIVGISAILLFNKMRTGSASAGKIKQEMEDYQGQVEAHFEETSKKFKDMAAQYQDLYQHLSVGATTLCRPDNSIAGLSDQRDPLAMAPTIELPANKRSTVQTENKVAGKKSVDIDSAPKAKSGNIKNNKQPESNQAETSKAKPRQAEPSRAEPSQAEPKKVKPDSEVNKPATK